MRVGYAHFYGLGDNMMIFEALYALKYVYGADVIVFGNALLCSLLNDCEFVDYAHDVIAGDGIGSEENLNIINSYNLDFMILTNCKRCFLNPLKTTNIKKIITITKLASLFSMRCATVPLLLLPKYRNFSQRECHLEFVRKIDSKRYDSCVVNLDFTHARLRVPKECQERIKEFLAPYRKQAKYYKMILLNPFSYTATYSLPLESFFLLMEEINKLESCFIVIATFPDVHNSFMQQLSNSYFFKTMQCDENKEKKLIIFQNNNDVLNLAALLQEMDILISPSTGAIHMASNLGIPTIGLFSFYDSIKWSTKDKRYVIIPKTLKELTEQESRNIIDETIKLLTSMLKE